MGVQLISNPFLYYKVYILCSTILLIGDKMCSNAMPAATDETESLRYEIKRANERYSDLEKSISGYIGYLEPFEVREGMEDDWKEIEKNNQDDEYSRAWFNYTVDWAKLMQDLQKNRVILTEEIIRETSFLADTCGITGFMHNAAVSALKKYWKYGDIFETGTKNSGHTPDSEGGQ